jgi:hypothetical protein
VTPTEMRKRIQEMQAKGELPSLDEVLDAVESVREKFKPKLEEARRAREKGKP